MVRLFVVVVACLGAAFGSHAMADTIYATGFEPPAYSLGALNGQNGWTAPTEAMVENATLYAGTQAVGFNAAGVTGGSEATISLPTNYGPTATISFEIMMYLTGGTQTSNWQPFAIATTSGYLGQIVVNNDSSAQLRGASTVGNVSIPLDVWNTFDLTVNLAAQTETGYVDGTLIGTVSLFRPTTNVSSISFGINSQSGGNTGPANDAGYFDNLVITATLPAPGASTLAPALALTAFAAWTRRRVPKTSASGATLA